MIPSKDKDALAVLIEAFRREPSRELARALGEYGAKARTIAPDLARFVEQQGAWNEDLRNALERIGGPNALKAVRDGR